MNTLEFAEKVGLAWGVKKTPVHVLGEEYPEFKAVVRMDNSCRLGIVGKGYGLVQNAQILNIAEEIGQGYDVEFGKGGTFNGGAKIWFTMPFPDTAEYVSEPKVGDRIRYEVNFRSSHDGSGMVIGRIDGIRLVCSNGMTVADTEVSFRVKHTVNALDHIQKYREQMSRAIVKIGTHRHNVEHLANTVATIEAISNYFKTVFPDPAPNPEKPRISRNVKVRDKLLRLNEDGRGAGFGRGTWWGAYNAVTEYVDHYKTARGSDADRKAHNTAY